MKKTILSTAIGFMMASAINAASATNTGGVVLYGTLDAGLDYQRISINGVRENSTNLESGISRPSNFGFRGFETLGNGTVVRFDLSSNFQTTSGRLEKNNKLFNQKATIGLYNDRYGGIDVGRQNNVASVFYRHIDPFSTYYGQAGVGSSFGFTNNVRYDSAVIYTTPNYNGFRGSIGYSFNTGIDSIYENNSYARPGDESYFENNDNQRAFTAGVSYDNGPLSVVLTYDQISAPKNVPGDSVNSIRSWSLGGAYDFEVVEVSAAFGQQRNGLVGEVNNNTIAIFNNDIRANSYMIGATVPMTASDKVFVSWQGLDPRKELRVGSKMQQVVSVGYEHDLSRRTTLYAYGSHANNYLMIDGATSFAVGAGIRHSF